MLEKKVKYKEAKQLKKGKEYLTRQYSLYFTKKESDTLELTPDKTVYISNSLIMNNIPETMDPQCREDLLFLMRFFQKNKANLKVTETERPKFEEIVKRLNQK